MDFEKLNESYKMIFNNFESTNNLGFYRFYYARIMPYLLSKIAVHIPHLPFLEILAAPTAKISL